MNKKEEKPKEKTYRAHNVTSSNSNQITRPNQNQPNPFTRACSRLLVIIQFIRTKQFILIINNMCIITTTRGERAPRRIRSLVSTTPGAHETTHTAPQTHNKHGKRLRDRDRTRNNCHGHSDQERIPGEPALTTCTARLAETDLPELAIPAGVDEVAKGGGGCNWNDDGEEQTDAADAVLAFEFFFFVGAGPRL